ncbi:MAG: hypothetical protein ABF652_12255 [Clostridium beijerinckii]
MEKRYNNNGNIYKGKKNIESKFDIFFATILFIIIAIQNNKFSLLQAIDLGFMRLDILDISTILCLFMLFFKAFNQRKIKVDKLLLYIFFYIIYGIIFGIINSYDTFSLFMDMRSVIYLIVSYLVFKQIEINKYKMIKIIKISALINSLYYIYSIVLKSSELGVLSREVSFNLFIGTLFLGIVLSDESSINLSDIIIIILVLISGILSQQRTVIIPDVLVIIIYVFKKICRVKNFFNTILTIICIFIIGVLVMFVLKKYNIDQIIYNRFNRDNFLGQESTLNLRVDSFKLYLSNSNLYNVVLGSGLGSTTNYYSVFGIIDVTHDFEMLLANYIFKYGIIGTVLFVIFFITVVRRSFEKDQENSFRKNLSITLVMILVGGFISGLAGYTGQLFLGIVLGIVGRKV